MACGVPCVTTDVGDSAWIVDVQGRSCRARDPAALQPPYASLIDTGEEGRRRLGSRDALASAEFSLSERAAAYEALYAEVLQCSYWSLLADRCWSVMLTCLATQRGRRRPKNTTC